MNIVVKSALAGAALTLAYACANPVEISGDVLPVDPSVFGDGGVLLGGAAGSTDLGGAAGTGAGTGGTSSGTGGTGTALGGSGGMQAGLSGAGGVPIGAGGSVGGGTGGTSGTAQGGAGGAGGAAAGTGGAAAGTGGAAAGTGGTGGTGTTPGTFDPGSCDFEDLSGCQELTCEAACSTTDGGSCRTRCETLIACVTTDPECTISEADPLCAVRDGGTPNACTQEADSAGGAATTQETQPAFVARQFVECICTTPRP